MAKRRNTYVIDSKKQLAALASAARQEIVDVLAQMGTASVAELAATLGRPADALYYHLRILQAAGLIRGDGKPEARYRAAGSELRIDYEAARQGGGKTLTAAISSMLRLGIRDFRAAIRHEDVVVSGPRRELWALRTTGWLTPNEVTRVNASMKALQKEVAKPRGRGDLYAITILLTPLNRKRR